MKQLYGVDRTTGMRYLTFLCICLLAACSTTAQSSGNIRLISYNVQNLFDAESDGSEYSQFVPGERWNLQYYQERKALLVAFLRDMDADIIAFQEIEDDTVMKDVQSALGDYPGIAYSDLPDRAIQVGLLARYPVQEVRTHILSDVDNLRPILEVHFSFLHHPFAIFVNHWKSRRGGVEQTEAIRIRSATLLQSLAQDLLRRNPDTAIIAMGDFNTSPFEEEDYPTAISHHSPGLVVTGDREQVADAPSLTWFSPWLDMRVPPGGSYWYRDHWEAIDGFFLTRHAMESEWLQFSHFQVVEDSRLLNKGGKPQKWSQSRSGYSDHLPVMLTLRWAIPGS